MKSLLTKADVVAAFTLLGQRAAREGLVVELFVVGGVAVMFGHPSAEARRDGVTQDVDAVFVRPDSAQLGRLRALIAEVQQSLDLSAGWLNDSAAKFVTRRSDGPLIHVSAGIQVRRATDLQLLGMKLGLTRRKTDLDDQDVLFDAIAADLKPQQVDAIWDWVRRYVPRERASAARQMLERLWEAKYGADDDTD